MSFISAAITSIKNNRSLQRNPHRYSAQSGPVLPPAGKKRQLSDAAEARALRTSRRLTLWFSIIFALALAFTYWLLAYQL